MAPHFFSSALCLPKRRRLLSFPLSLVLHLLAASGVLLLSLLSASELPAPRIWSHAQSPASPTPPSKRCDEHVPPPPPIERRWPLPGPFVDPRPLHPPPVAPVLIGGRIEPPLKLHHVEPVYPRLAQRLQIQGEVVIEGVIGLAGRLEQVRVLRGQPLLSTAAVEAVDQWRYRPAILNGMAMPATLRVTARFTLGDPDRPTPGGP